MRYLCILLVMFVFGCTPVSQLEQVKRGQGLQILYDLDITKMRDICEIAFVDVGLQIRVVNEKKDRIEILAYEAATEIEYGSVYGIYLYPITPNTTELNYIRKTKYPTRVFAKDLTEELLAKIDEYVLDAMGI